MTFIRKLLLPALIMQGLVLCNSLKMTNKKWFLLLKNQVSGPFEAGEIESQIAKEDNVLIWGRGYSEWMQPAEWRQSANPGSEANNPVRMALHYKYKIGEIESEP